MSDQKPKNPWEKGSEKKRSQEKPQTNIDGGKSSPSSNSSLFIEELKAFADQLFGNKGSGGGGKPRSPMFLGLIGAGVLFSLWASQGFYRVQEGEVGVVLRFGKLTYHTGPGLHYHWPYPFEYVVVQNVSSINRIDGIFSPQDQDEKQGSSLILTGDENMVFTNYTVLWKIKDVDQFLFTARHPEETIRAAAESCFCEVVGQTTARMALTEGRDSIGQKAQDLLQKLLDHYQLGVQIISVQLQKVEPPKPVLQAFYDVQASLVDADRARNEAEAYRNDILPRARGLAEKIIQQAKGEAQKILSNAEGEAQAFEAIAEEVSKNKKGATARYYYDAVEEVLSNPDNSVQKVIIDPQVSKNMVPFLPLPNHFKPSAHLPEMNNKNSKEEKRGHQ